MSAKTEYRAPASTQSKLSASEIPDKRASARSGKGWINTYFRYHKGKKLGPYYVRRWKLNGKVHKEYIKPKDVETAKEECARYRANRRLIVYRFNNTIANLKYIDRMVKWSEQGRLRPQDHAFISRLEHEGWDIGGRPKLRKKIFRDVVTIFGETVVLKTIFEFDGTTKTSLMRPPQVNSSSSRMRAALEEGFMVPFITNYRKAPRNPLISALKRVQKSLRDIWPSAHAPKETEDSPPNQWLQRTC